VRHGARETIKFPDHYSVKAPAVGVGDQAVKLWPLFLGARDAEVHVFAGNGPAAAPCILAQFANLHLRRLAVTNGADAGIECGSHHRTTTLTLPCMIFSFFRLEILRCRRP